MHVDNVKVLYYREQEIRGIKRPRLRVVPKEDLWDTLVNAQNQLCHGRRDRIQAYFLEHMHHLPREVTLLFLRLSGKQRKERKSTQKIIHKPIIAAGVSVRGQADLVDLQLCPDNGYKFILNYQNCFSKFVALRPLQSKTSLVHIFCEHAPSHILHTDDGTEYSNKTLIAVLYRLWSSTRIVHGRPRYPEDQGSVERANADFKKILYARLKDESKEQNQWSVHFGRTPPDISVGMLLPREVVQPLDTTENQLEQAFGSRRVIKYASPNAAAPTIAASPSPIPLPYLSLQESPSEADLLGVTAPLPPLFDVICVKFG